MELQRSMLKHDGRRSDNNLALSAVELVLRSELNYN